MDRLDTLRLFIAVADRGSFSEAARDLRLPPTSASRAIGRLEADLGVTLLRRTTRSVRLTPEGEAYRARIVPLLAAFDSADRELRGERGEPAGRLTLTAPVLFGRLHVRPAVTTLLARHPRLSVALVLTDRLVRVAEEGVDVAVRIADLADSALHAIRLTETRAVLAASPAYLAARGTPAAPADLAAHRLIGSDSLGGSRDWRFAGDHPAAIRAEPWLTTTDLQAAIDAAMAGAGIVRALLYQVQQPIDDGRLRRLLPGFEPPPTPISLVFQANRRAHAGASAFIAEMQARFA